MTKDKSKFSLFWQLQISGWLVLFLVYLLLYYRNYWDDTRTLAGLLITYVAGFIISILLRKFYQRIKYQSRSILFISIAAIVSTIVSANLWFWLDVLLTKIILGNVETYNQLTINRYISYIWTHSFVMFLWSALYFSIKLWDEWRIQKNRAEKADELAHSAQLQMLRYQLNPHFLFNSLNSIRALVEEDKLRAKSMITELAEFLRYSLISKNYSDVPLSNELEAMKHYFSIEKTRYEDKLEVNFDIDPQAEEYPVLSFLMHPLIENAIKYGMKTSKLPLKIDITAKVENNLLRIKVCNTGKWIEPSSNENKKTSTGTGLSNVKQRLENAFPNSHSFQIQNDNDRVCIQLEINKNKK